MAGTTAPCVVSPCEEKLKQIGTIMLVKAKTLEGYKLHSLDGEIGRVKEFYFDDKHWTIRYLIADTGNWLMGRKVLISPYSLGEPIKGKHEVVVNLTKKQIEDSPLLDSDKPVSRQYEETYFAYNHFPRYWNGPHVWGAMPDPSKDSETGQTSDYESKAWNPNLRSTREVSSYHIHAIDGDIGHVFDFIIDDKNWTIRYLIIDTRDWWPGKKVLIAPRWIERVSWSDSKVFVNFSRESIQHAPEYTEKALLTREDEVGIYSYYKRQGYWVNNIAA